MINVTKTFLPPIEEYTAYLQQIWQSGWITNNGELLQELEQKVTQFLGAPQVQIVNNGMIALQIAIKALDLHGEIITTPFSYVATTTAILWEQCKPVFVDIENRTFCIDSEQIEAAITENTSAILATHVYGYPCNVKAIAAIAQKYNLHVIYDGAHAFGSVLNGVGVLNFGDISTLSFHATKLFHTIEGGALVVNSEEMAKKIWLLKSFGHLVDEYSSIGTNGKMSEFHAAMGLCMLPRVGEFIQRRKLLSLLYDELLIEQGLQRPIQEQGLEYNYAYYPVIFPTFKDMMAAKEALAKRQINTRRYFYPSLNTLPYHKGESCPISEDIASRVLCLPLYVELEEQSVRDIAAIIKSAL
jgi:dTDP-4-amino-4,6-dideoxygalactose transaminase